MGSLPISSVLFDTNNVIVISVRNVLGMKSVSTATDKFCCIWYGKYVVYIVSILSVVKVDNI